MTRKADRPAGATRVELRRQAEETLREKTAQTPENLDTLSPVETLAMLHELRVHQIELEMQNEELRRAQLQLDTERARYFDLWELAPVGYLTISETGLILEANLTAVSLLGVPRTLLVRRSLSQFFLKKDQDVYYLHLRQILQSGGPQSCELRMVNDGGMARVRWVHLEATVAQDEAGASAEYRGPDERRKSPRLVIRIVLSDISERKQAEEVLRESEVKHKSMIANTSDVIAIMDRDGTLQYKSPNIEKWFGWQPEDLVGTDGWKTVHPDDLERIQNEFWILLEKDNAKKTVEYRYQCKDGSYKWIELTAVNLTHDPIIHGVLMNYHDITERKHVEDVMRESEAKLKKAQHFAHVGSWTWNIKENQLAWSDEMFRLFGLERETFTGSLDDVIARSIHPEDRSKVDQSNLSVIQNQQPVPLEYRVVWPDQSVHWVWAEAGEMILDEMGSVSSLSGTILDITERKRASEEIRQMNADLEQRVADRTIQLTAANQELEAFSYSVSHDLRAPLRSLDGFSIVLLEDYAGQLDEPGKNYLARIQEASRRMNQLINDLLDLSRVTRADFTRQRVDLSALANSIAAELKAQSPQRQVEFEITVDLIVQGDASLLKIVLENLLNNAYKFTSRREQASIQVGRVEQDGQWIYFVRDNGAGFDMDYANKLFGAFQRLHSEKEFPGTGIGLATVQRIIHRHGGRVWAEGAVDQGATFYFTIA